jgi:hypothetical protein
MESQDQSLHEALVFVLSIKINDKAFKMLGRRGQIPVLQLG